MITVEITISATFESESDADDYYFALREHLQITADHTGIPTTLNITSDFA